MEKHLCFAKSQSFPDVRRLWVLVFSLQCDILLCFHQLCDPTDPTGGCFSVSAGGDREPQGPIIQKHCFHEFTQVLAVDVLCLYMLVSSYRAGREMT